MSAEELSETLAQIKAFRMQQESRMGLSFLSDDGKVEDAPRELASMQASHAETVLELQKTTHLLLVEHQISKDLQVHTIIASVRKIHSFHFSSHLICLFLQGRVEHCQAKDREREGGEQEEGGREGQTFIKKSSSDQHSPRY